jgi:hypothetical protein
MSLLTALTGPGEPEIGCDECFDALDTYVELMLAGAAADERFPGMRAHLVGCPACHEDFLSLFALVARDDGATPP